MILKKIKKNCVIYLVSILTITSFFIPVNYNTQTSYALSNDEDSNISIMQEAFFELISMNANNSNLKKSDIESSINKLENEKIEKRKDDSFYTYKLKDERLELIISDYENKIESIIYKKYNPSKDMSMLRAQYSDLGEENGKYIRLEISSSSIKYIDTISKELNAKFINTTFYSDYLKIFNKLSSDKTITKDDLVKINPKISEDKRRLNDGSGQNSFITINDDYNGLTIITNKDDNKFRFIDVSSSLPVKVYNNDLSKLKMDSLKTQLISDLDKESLNYFNFSDKDEFGHTLMLFKGNDKDLQKTLLEISSITSR